MTSWDRVIKVVQVVDHEGSDSRVVVLSNGEYIPFSLSGHSTPAEEFADDVKYCIETGLHGFLTITDDDPHIADVIGEGKVVWVSQEVLQ